MEEEKKEDKKEDPTKPTHTAVIKTNDVQNFESFKQGDSYRHVLICGSTDSGKTSKIVTFIYSKLFKDYQIFFLVAKKSGVHKNLENIRQAVLWDLADGDEVKLAEIQDKCFYYYPEEQVQEALNKMNELKHVRKLVFFDDMQIVDDKKAVHKMATFISSAKNIDTQCIIAAHKVFNDENLKKVRNACGYYVINNLNSKDFNLLLDLHGESPALQKYNRINDRYEKSLIYDVENRKLFLALPPYNNFMPIIDQT